MTRPLQGSEDVCVLNFCVFLFWDYVPTVWLLLVMEGTTAEDVGTSVVKVGGQSGSRLPAGLGGEGSDQAECLVTTAAAVRCVPVARFPLRRTSLFAATARVANRALEKPPTNTG